jgi:hypothetical protein
MISNVKVTQLNLVDGGCYFHVSGKDTLYRVSKSHVNYNAICAGLLLASARGWSLDVDMAGTSSDSVSMIQVHIP